MSGGINKAETAAALVVVALGVFVIAVGQSYPMGTLARMGPGYFPVLLGSALTLIGIGLVFEVLRSSPVKLSFSLRPFVALTAGIVAFAVLVERAGLVPAIWALVFLSVMGEQPVRIKNAVGISVVMSLIGVFVFIKGLGIPLSMFWW